jgi:carboxyl-terminal processing protease
VIGTQTFGKGSVQTIMPLGNNTAIKLTTARYYTPSGRSIQAKGITPDVIVEEPGASQLSRVREADLTRHLGNSQEEKEAAAKAATQAARSKPAATPAAPAEPFKPIELGTKEDFQLQQALAYLKGQPVVKSPPPAVAQTKPGEKAN